MKFEFNNKEIRDLEDLKGVISDDQRQEPEKALSQFKISLSGDVESQESIFQFNEFKATSFHNGVSKDGSTGQYPLPLSEESDGTLKLMARAAAIEEALHIGGTLVIDEIENRIHPLLVEYIIKRFQMQKGNQKAQLIFTTHSTDIMSRNMLRRDQYYFVDKNNRTGVSELYSLSDFSIRKEENISRAYLLGKYGAVPFVAED